MNSLTNAASQSIKTYQSEASQKGKTTRAASQFRYYIHDSVESFRVQLLGHFAEADLPELQGCFQTAKSTLANRKLILDLTGLQTLDEAARQWLASMSSEHAIYIPDSFSPSGILSRNSSAPEARIGRKPSGLRRLRSLLRGSRVLESPTQAQ